VVRKNTRYKPVEEYLKQQRRFSHLTPELIQTIQKRVDLEYEKLLKMETLTGSAETKAEDKEE